MLFDITFLLIPFFAHFVAFFVILSLSKDLPRRSQAAFPGSAAAAASPLKRPAAPDPSHLAMGPSL